MAVQNEKDQKSEMISEKRLNDVTGGRMGGKADMDVKVPKTEIKYCKYCNKETAQWYNGRGDGWPTPTMSRWCDLWECQECRCTNYWRQDNGELI